MTDEELAAAKARVNAKVSVPVEPGPVPESEPSSTATPKAPKTASVGWDFLQRFKWLVVASLAIGGVQVAMTSLLDPGGEETVFYRLLALLLGAFVAFVFLLLPKRRRVTAAEKQTSLIYRHKWLAFFLPYLFAGMVAAAAQASIILFMDYESGRYEAFIFATWLMTLAAGLWLVPELVKPDALFRGFAQMSMLMGAIYFSGTQVWQVEPYWEEYQSEKIAAMQAHQAAEQEVLRFEQEVLRSKMEAQAAAEQRKLREAERATQQAAVNRALADFRLPIPSSKCDWGWLPTGFETVSYRDKVQAIFSERTQGLEKCLQQELDQNLDAFSQFLTTQVGGEYEWQEPDEPAKTWTDLTQQMEIYSPYDICQSSCSDQLIALRNEVGRVAQNKADSFDKDWAQNMRVVVNPAIERGDELDWELEREELKEKAAEAGAKRQREQALRNSDGGFGEFIRGITQASNDMVRRTESPSNRYQRMVNENLQYQGAKEYRAKRDAFKGITLDQTTREPSKSAGRDMEDCERAPYESRIADRGRYAKNGKPYCHYDEAVRMKAQAEAKVQAKLAARMCPIPVPKGVCAKKGYNEKHCLTYKRPNSGCSIAK